MKYSDKALSIKISEYFTTQAPVIIIQISKNKKHSIIQFENGEVTRIGVCLEYRKTTYPCCHVLQFMFNLLKCVNFVLKKIIKNGI